jgi:hypothetical protein
VSLRLHAVAVAVALACAPAAHAAEPGEADVACLASVLSNAPSAVSVRPAADISYDIDHFPRNIRATRRGVEYTFRKPDRTQYTVGIYLQTQLEGQRTCDDDPNCVEGGVHGPSTYVEANNGRFQIWLRPPYPAEWYPPCKRVDRPKGWSCVQQYSPDHPLFGLWGQLKEVCRADDIYILKYEPLE